LDRARSKVMSQKQALARIRWGSDDPPRAALRAAMPATRVRSFIFAVECG